MSIFKRKHKHDWEYPEHYSKHCFRTCKTCGKIEYWHEAHYGTWETDPQGNNRRT